MNSPLKIVLYCLLAILSAIGHTTEVERCSVYLQKHLASKSLHDSMSKVWSIVDKWLMGEIVGLGQLESSITQGLTHIRASNYPDVKTMAENDPYFQGSWEATSPPTPPRSGSLVFIMYHDNKPMAVYKIFNSIADLSRDLITNRLMHKLDLGFAQAAEYFALRMIDVDGKQRPALIMEYVPEHDMEAVVREVGQKLNVLRHQPDPNIQAASDVQRPLANIMNYAALILSDIHALDLAQHHPIDPALKEHEISRVRESFSARRMREYVQNGWITASEGVRLRQIVEDRLRRYRDDREIPGTFVHGDAHPGNMVIDPAVGGTWLIDTETMFWSIKRENGSAYGVGDPIADLGRFISGFALHAQKNGFTIHEVLALTHEVVSLYLIRTQFDFDAVELYLDFHAFRFAGVILKSTLAENGSREKQIMLNFLKEKFLAGQ